MYEPNRISTMVSQTLKLMSAYSPMLASAPDNVKIRYSAVLMELSALNSAILVDQRGD